MGIAVEGLTLNAPFPLPAMRMHSVFSVDTDIITMRSKFTSEPLASESLV